MTISLHLHDIRDHDRIRARDSGLRLEVIHRERQEMTDEKIEESLRAIYRVIPVQPLQVEPLREVVREIMKRSYIQGSNDHHAATVAAQTEISSACVGREQALDLLILLSALESAFLASKATIPDYLLERIGDSVEMLRGEVLT